MHELSFSLEYERNTKILYFESMKLKKALELQKPEQPKQTKRSLSKFPFPEFAKFPASTFSFRASNRFTALAASREQLPAVFIINPSNINSSVCCPLKSWKYFHCL